jgi:hypothetical protein
MSILHFDGLIILLFLVPLDIFNASWNITIDGEGLQIGPIVGTYGLKCLLWYGTSLFLRSVYPKDPSLFLVHVEFLTKEQPQCTIHAVPILMLQMRISTAYVSSMIFGNPKCYDCKDPGKKIPKRMSWNRTKSVER